MLFAMRQMEVNQASGPDDPQALVKCHMNRGSAVGPTLRFGCTPYFTIEARINDSKEALGITLDI
jgi:hypothetical protein